MFVTQMRRCVRSIAAKGCPAPRLHRLRAPAVPTLGQESAELRVPHDSAKRAPPKQPHYRWHGRPVATVDIEKGRGASCSGFPCVLRPPSAAEVKVLDMWLGPRAAMQEQSCQDPSLPYHERCPKAGIARLHGSQTSRKTKQRPNWT